MEDGPETDMRPPCLEPDVTFVVEQTEIRAHKLVLAMQSPVFAAQFRWQTNDGAAATRVVIEDMRASTFRAMLRFIYTDELPIKPTSKDQPACKQIYAARRREAMARDLLVAADRHKNSRSSSSKKAAPSSLITEIMERVAAHNSSSSDRVNGLPPGKTWSTYNMSQKVHGVHEFRIPNFRSVQSSHGVGHVIHSGAFHVGGYNWRIEVNPSGDAGEDQGNISVYLRLLTDPPDRGVEVSSTFKIFDPRRKSTMAIDYVEQQICAVYAGNNEGWGLGRLITLESAKSKYLAHDGSLTIHCNVALITNPYTITCSPTTRAMITVPESSIASQLGKLLAMLNFAYTDKLEPLVSTGAAGEMLGAACRFGLDRMRAICQNFLAENISKDNALDMLKLAHCHNCSKLEDCCIEFIRPWPLLAKEAKKTVSILQATPTLVEKGSNVRHISAGLHLSRY
ncbi:TD and POZ domain-containing protein 2-like [Triticum aestivum]|uniref:TD and POZ domain-containing protein 2-like n=1 Tax=Triticum aestivum TaxID=4565 RepID=UPI001D0326D9|nr:TD and POZ domain-containing protein 2-like [Triticum aestivum]